MGEGIADCLPLAIRSVGDAIKLDSDNRIKEAYCQYLSCIIYISQVLKDDAWDKDLRLVYNSDTAKLFRLLQQCQERALMVISSVASNTSTSQTPGNQIPQHLHLPSEGVPHRYSDSHVLVPGQSAQHQLAPQGATIRKLSYTNSPTANLAKPTNDENLYLPSPPGSPLLRHHHRTGSYDPLEKAYKENKQLIQAYRTRMQNANKGGTNKDMISRNLSLMRRMSENLAIAKAREQAIKQKLWERQRRLQEETNRRLGPAVYSTKEQQEQRIIYTKILEFEQETVWPKLLRNKLKLSPEDPKLIKEIITKIFSSSDHPLTQFLLQYQYHVYRKLAPLVKDVGFPDVKSGRVAVNEGTCTTVKKFHSNEPAGQSVLIEDEQNEGKNLNTLINAEGDFEGHFSSETNLEENVKGTREIVRGTVREEGHETVEHHDVRQDSRDGDTVEKGKRNVDSECASSETDLTKLKNLLGDDNQSEVSETDTSQPDAVVTGSDSATLESYFDELEDDMFGWDSNEDESDGTDIENVDGGKEKTTGDEKNCSELKEDTSQYNLEEGTTQNVVGSSISVNVTEHSQADPSEVCADTHSRLRLDSTNASDTFADGDLSTQSVENVELPTTIKNEKTSQDQPKDDANPFEADGFISDQKVEANEEETARNNTKGESKQSHSSLKPHGQANSRDEGKIPTPKLAGFAREQSGKEEDDQTTPTTTDSDERRKQLKDVLVDVRFFLEKLQKLLILAYEQLDTPAGRDLCYSFLEFPFFKPLWPMLLAVLRQVNHEKELTLADVMSENIAKDPEDLGVPHRLCLKDQTVLGATGNSYPYQMAVDELHKVSTLYCPLEKLECLVRTSRCVCQCVEDYWETKGKSRHCPETAIGCDDLLPILSFVIIRSGMAQLISECDAMEEFIPEGYLMGEEGYCLTTLLTALAYLATLKPT
ncbi:VPS9 domain-containing protein 1 [Stylophora pistillata]|uniref:VPS9 domain-containing protein 1 n=1 Tax=Stylophora pistillata TaxID=50429 RepID=A0A2B4S0H9_STYPI|nr:VPS9 domain-containing protein 1 [Stylophora pistillata]